MNQRKQAKRAWMDVLAGYREKQIKSAKAKPIIEKWRELHDHGQVKIVNDMLDIQGGEIFLDCGCGGGRVLTQFEDKCLTIGIDISAYYCHAAKKAAPHSLIIQGDIENLPLKDESIDVCVMIYTFVYAPDKKKTMEEIYRVLKKDGKLIIFDPNYLSLRTFLRKLQVVKHKLSKKEDSPIDIGRLLVTTQCLSFFAFRKLACEVGFECNSWRGNFETIPFPMITEGGLSKITLLLFWLWEKLGCKKWGKLPLIRYFSDFLIIKLVKREERKTGN